MSRGIFADACARHHRATALEAGDTRVSYGELASLVARRRRWLAAREIVPGRVVSLEADFSPPAVALLLALFDLGAVVVPLARSTTPRKETLRALAEVETVVACSGETVELRATGRRAGHELLRRLRREARPGLVLFSSGSSGESKAIVHDVTRLFEKFRVRRRAWRTLLFLLFDHIGGLNTLFHTLAHGGSAVTAAERSPDAVCRAIERHRVELLPTSPTFLHLLLASEAYRRHDLSSLELITYGTEVMPPGTLTRLRQILPGARLEQTYGLSEVGILGSRSRSSDSLWMRLGGEGFETRVRGGQLEIRARSAMLGYLNAPSPFTADGWLTTGDEVEVDGDEVRILGRRSEIINVGGEKVYPVEVEDVLHAMEGVVEAAVRGEANALTGELVLARVRLSTGESLREFRRRLLAFCGARLPRYKVPQKVELVDRPLHGERYKTLRG